MKRHKFIVVLLIFIVAAGLLVYQLLPKGQDKVSATISIESKGLDITSAHMVMQSTMYSEDGTSNPKMSEEVWLEMPGKMHSEMFKTGESLPYAISTFNGRDMLTASYNPDGKCHFAQLQKNLPLTPGMLGANPFNKYFRPISSYALDGADYRILGPATVCGREAIKVQKLNMAPGGSPGTSESYLYVDSETSIELKREGFYEGKLTFMSEVTKIELNENFKEEMFQFEIPSGIHEADSSLNVQDYMYQALSDKTQLPKQVDFNPVAPQSLPEGFSLLEAGYLNNPNYNDFIQPWGHPVLYTYSDGKNYIFICEDGLRGSQKENPGSAIRDPDVAKIEFNLTNDKTAFLMSDYGIMNGELYLETGGLKILITGTIDMEQLKKVAASIE